MQTELAVLDLAVLEPAQQRLQARVTSGPRVERREAGAQLAVVTHARESLEAERPLLDDLTQQQIASLRGFGLLGAKPWAIACNAPDDEAAAMEAQRLKAARDDWCVVAADTEAELDDLSAEDAAAFREDLGLPGLATERVGQALRAAMDQVTFYTGNTRSVNAWLLPRGASRPGSRRRHSHRSGRRLHSGRRRGGGRPHRRWVDVRTARSRPRSPRRSRLRRVRRRGYPGPLQPLTRSVRASPTTSATDPSPRLAR